MLNKWLVLDLDYDSTNLAMKFATALIFAIAVYLFHEFFRELPTTLLLGAIVTMSAFGFLFATLFPIAAKILPVAISSIFASILVIDFSKEKYDEYHKDKKLISWLKRTNDCEGMAVINKSSYYHAACMNLKAICFKVDY